MNAEIVEIGIEAQVFGMRPSAGTAQIRSLQPFERIRNALPKLGAFWGIGFFCILLPLIHFILVPLFLCLGIYFAAKATAVRGLVMSGSVLCPGCKNPHILGSRLAQWPMKEVCAHCRRDFELCARQA